MDYLNKILHFLISFFYSNLWFCLYFYFGEIRRSRKVINIISQRSVIWLFTVIKETISRKIPMNFAIFNIWIIDSIIFANISVSFKSKLYWLSYSTYNIIVCGECCEQKSLSFWLSHSNNCAPPCAYQLLGSFITAPLKLLWRCKGIQKVKVFLQDHIQNHSLTLSVYHFWSSHFGGVNNTYKWMYYVNYIIEDEVNCRIMLHQHSIIVILAILSLFEACFAYHT